VLSKVGKFYLVSIKQAMPKHGNETKSKRLAVSVYVV